MKISNFTPAKPIGELKMKSPIVAVISNEPYLIGEWEYQGSNKYYHAMSLVTGKYIKVDPKCLVMNLKEVHLTNESNIF